MINAPQKLNGRTLRNEMLAAITQVVEGQDTKPHMMVFVMGNNPATRTFISLKKKFALRTGIHFQLVELPLDYQTNDVVAALQKATSQHPRAGIIVQLPLPDHIDTDTVLQHIPVQADVDCLHPETHSAWMKGNSPFIPPVAGAVLSMLASINVSADLRYAVVGYGKLVGKPVADMFRLHGVDPLVIDINTKGGLHTLQDQDVVISGVGNAWMLLPEHIKDGAIVLDAGTSESQGELKGDVHPDCYQKCSYYSPVPGGVGPLTVSWVLRNCVAGSDDAISYTWLVPSLYE